MGKFSNIYLIKFYIILSMLMVPENCEKLFHSKITPIDSIFPGEPKFIKGKTIILSCAFETNFDIDSVIMTWNKPNRTPLSQLRYFVEQNIKITNRTIISKIEIDDANEDDHIGLYQCNIKAEQINETVEIFVIVLDIQKLLLKEIYSMKDNEVKIECFSDTFPLPTFNWEFIPCGLELNWAQNCNSSRIIHFNENSISDLQFQFNVIKESRNKQIAQLIFIATEFGLIKCLAKNEIGRNEVLAKIIIGDIIEPFGITEMNKTVNNKIYHLNDGEELSLECAALIYKSKYNVNWYRDNQIIKNTPDIEVLASTTKYTYKKVLKFTKINSANQGEYECIVYPIDSELPEKRKVSIEVRGNNYWYIIASAIIFLLIVFIIIILIIKIFRVWKIRKAFTKFEMEHMKMKALGNFQKENIDPGLKFEFSKSQLTLGNEILGQGVFGEVRKAVAKNIIPSEQETVVAVKLPKNDSNESLKSLASELKIMISLGKHLNIVNLLGVVTQNVNELMVIVEFCQYGNIKDYLIKNRENFINQINPESGEIKISISAPAPDGSEMNITDTATSLLKYYQSYSINQHSQNLTTVDLIKWSYQVVRGMEYLASRNVLHGDLAARNILLCNDNVVKICDFGLAKSMYNKNLYKKQTAGLLPIKWLAIECLDDSIFSTQSDVWSFGITLWEIFSLGRTPYPGIPANEKLLYKLRKGYRMEKSEYANQELYEIMLDCWNAVPKQRPTFSDLKKQLEKILQEDVIAKYLYLPRKLNTEDYLIPLNFIPFSEN